MRVFFTPHFRRSYQKLPPAAWKKALAAPPHPHPLPDGRGGKAGPFSFAVAPSRAWGTAQKRALAAPLTRHVPCSCKAQFSTTLTDSMVPSPRREREQFGPFSFVVVPSQAWGTVQKAFEKQLTLLLQDLRHPSLRAEKYDESLGVWQARVTRGYRFYFTIEGDAYVLHEITAHEK